MNPSIFSSARVPANCTPTTAFLEKASAYFGTCIPTPLAFTSTLLGTMSILSWLFAQMPQIYKNYQLKSTAGLSIVFLVEWLMGDVTNLLGALFLHQATWQVILASYYCFVDICLVFQYFWYTYGLPRWREGSIYSSGGSLKEDENDADSDMINSLSPINSSFAEDQRNFIKDDDQAVSSASSQQRHSTPQFLPLNDSEEKARTALPLQFTQPVNLEKNTRPPRTMLFAATLSSLVVQAAATPIKTTNEFSSLDVKTSLEVAGTILSWCSTALYLGSRLPQLYKNWKRQSTAGVSPYLFLAAFLGNLFYSSSMVTNPNVWYNFGPYGGYGWADKDGSKRKEWIVNATPFFLGAFGVLWLDATMGVQFLMYGEEQEKVVKVRDVKGAGRWQRVNGWMRGWIPSIRKEKIVDLAESQRLLSQSRESDRHGHHSQYGGI